MVVHQYKLYVRPAKNKQSQLEVMSVRKVILPYRRLHNQVNEYR